MKNAILGTHLEDRGTCPYSANLYSVITLSPFGFQTERKRKNYRIVPACKQMRPERVVPKRLPTRRVLGVLMYCIFSPDLPGGRRVWFRDRNNRGFFFFPLATIRVVICKTQYYYRGHYAYLNEIRNVRTLPIFQYLRRTRGPVFPY